VDTHGADRGRASELPELLAAHPTSIARILADHRDDGSGRCTVCHAGPQSARVVWPCRLRLLAEAARRRRGGRL
jgi:hypothetical protein